MEQQELIKGITLFVSAWCWWIITIMILCTSAIMLAVEKYTFAFGFLGAFTFSAYKAFKKKKELESLEDN